MVNVLPSDLFLAMLKAGAMAPGKDDKSFDINFAIVEKDFPSYLEFMVVSSLNDVEKWAYENGYMTYIVLPNGLLKWHPTQKRYNQ